MAPVVRILALFFFHESHGLFAKGRMCDKNGRSMGCATPPFTFQELFFVPDPLGADMRPQRKRHLVAYKPNLSDYALLALFVTACITG